MLSVLKGKLDGKTVQIAHLRYDWPKARRNGETGIGNGPKPVQFLIDQESDDPFEPDKLVGRTYLVYFVTTKDNRLSFVNGDMDSHYSVFEITRPYRN
ncbi:hypothetical protein RISK_004351 [Rhodopirellula islandica]|uniref:Uncharacterized protein n=1 Tax=Rhodopirellula islandica TaxID=595434 RepID=A0A0J1EDI8_RHOIS|nr:hypothetical protein RISK_004351 [Rhodopirellula islandica]